MRISGFASGMDIDQMVKDLMKAERIPLNKIEQTKTKTEWQRDAYREMNVMLRELDDAMLNMRLQSTYTSKTTSTSNQAVTATASAGASNGTYRIEVSTLATSAINVTNGTLSNSAGLPATDENKFNPFDSISSQIGKLNGFEGEENPFAGDMPKIEFTTHHKGEAKSFSYEVSDTDTLNSVLTRITNADNGVRAFYDIGQDRVIFEKTSAGNYLDGNEIQFEDDSFVAKLFNMTQAGENGGTDATFKYNGVELTSKTNQTTLNGITFNFNNVTDGVSANVNVMNDTDAAVDKVMAFVDKYNALVDEIIGRTRETVHRDYHPLSEEEMRELSDREVEMWDEKARSGLLRNDQLLSSGLTQMRQAWTSPVNNEGSFTHISQIGITTSRDYMNGGKLEVNEDKLRAALRDDPNSVHKLFSNNVQGEGKGIFNKLNDAVDQTVDRINSRAGRSTSQPHQYTLGRQIRNFDQRIDNFNRRLGQIENRYWSQFTAMEKAIAQMNEQSNMLFSQMMGQG